MLEASNDRQRSFEHAAVEAILASVAPIPLRRKLLEEYVAAIRMHEAPLAWFHRRFPRFPARLHVLPLPAAAELTIANVLFQFGRLPVWAAFDDLRRRESREAANWNVGLVFNAGRTLFLMHDLTGHRTPFPKIGYRPARTNVVYTIERLEHFVVSLDKKWRNP